MYHGDWHRHYHEIGNYISRGKDGQHIQGVRALGQEECDGCPIETPFHSALKNRRKEKSQAPC